MKKFMCLALAVCMVFVLAGTVLAADLEPQAVNYNNERYETNSKEQNGIQWILEAVVAIGADSTDDMYIEDDDWYPFKCNYCCDLLKEVGEEGERCNCWCFPQTPCVCCDTDFPYFIGPSRYLWVDDYDSGLPDTSNDYRDYITKVLMTPGCEYDEDFDIYCRTGYTYCEWWVDIVEGDTYPEDFPDYPAYGDDIDDSDWVCPAYIFPSCIPEKGDCGGPDYTLGCYPECIPCGIEILSMDSKNVSKKDYI